MKNSLELEGQKLKGKQMKMYAKIYDSKTGAVDIVTSIHKILTRKEGNILYVNIFSMEDYYDIDITNGNKIYLYNDDTNELIHVYD